MQDNRVIYKYIEKIFRERGNKTRTYDRLPKDSEGNNGDFAIHTANRGSNIYVKFANKWWFLSRLSKPTRESGKHIGVPPDGNFKNLQTTEDVIIPESRSLYLDGKGGHTYIKETSNDILDVYVGGDNVMKVDEGNAKISFPSGSREVGIGNNGNLEGINILPSHFMTDKTRGLVFDKATGGVKLGDATGRIYGIVDIPLGFTATEVMIEGSVADSVGVYVADTDDSSVSLSIGSGNMGTTVDITDTAATTTNFLIIDINTGSTSDVVYGGYVTIEVS